MYFTDPSATRISHNARLVEARQARTPHQPETLDPKQPSAGRRFLSFVSSFGRTGGSSAGLLSDSHELFVGHDQKQLTRLAQCFTVVHVPAGRALGQQGPHRSRVRHHPRR